MKKNTLRSLAAGVAALAAVGAAVVASTGAALASGGGGPTPPWESSVTPNGFLTFYNAQGQVVTGGSLTASGLGVYAVASSADSRSGDSKATLYVYTPVSGENPGLWSGEQISGSTSYPNATAPAPIGTTSNPVESNTNGTDVSLSSYIAGFPNTQTAAGYPNLYDVRMKVSGFGIGIEPTYWDTVISVNTQAGTWSVDWPDWTQGTTTTLTASPPSPQSPPASPVTLTATVSPATSGTVSFWKGSTQIGTTQTVTSGNGVASVQDTPGQGTTNYKAIFTPANVASGDIGSAGTLSYQVVSAPTWIPVVFGPNKVGSVENCVAGFQNATSVTYAWQSNGTAITGQTASTFTPPPALLGQMLTCSVKASNGAGSVSGTSAGVKILLGNALVPVTKPVISGPHLPGKAETVTAGTWSPAAQKVTYQWFVGTTKITGATKSSFTVPSTARGKTVHCVVTASATGYANGVYTTPSVTIT
ncbi:MAG TPA: hypothetical protein VF834_11420 [Streptosporangiaceae bacterium]